jgi:hypothetical protein
MIQGGSDFTYACDLSAATFKNTTACTDITSVLIADTYNGLGCNSTHRYVIADNLVRFTIFNSTWNNITVPKTVVGSYFGTVSGACLNGSQFWVLNDTGGKVFMINSTGNFDLTKNFTISVPTHVYRGLDCNATHFWTMDTTSQWIVWFNKTGHIQSGVIDYTNITGELTLFLARSKYGFIINDLDNGKMEYMKDPILKWTGTTLKVTQVSCTNTSYAKILTGGTGSTTGSVLLNDTATSITMASCQFGATNVRRFNVTNRTDGCHVNFTTGTFSGNAILEFAYFAPTKTSPPSNLPAAITAVSISVVIVIYGMTKKYKSKGW